jgi:type I restriction enzyme S subunit
MTKLMEKQKFKQTEIGEIPEDWEVLSIETLISRELIEKPLDGNHGNIHPKNNDFIEDGIPFVMANNIHDGNLNLKTCHYISQKQADKLQKGFAIIGDVLLTHKGTVGNVAIVEKLETPYIMLTPQVTYYRVKNSNMLCSSYIKQYFQYNLFQQTIKNISGGGTRAYIGITTQRQLPFILSSIQEQIAIATVLSDTDELITSLDKLIAKKKAIKQCAMQELLTGKKRLPGFGKQKGFKQTELGEIPEDWEIKTFADICWVNQGLQIAIEKRCKNPTVKSKKYITIQNLNNDKGDEYIDDYVSSVCCSKDDILMTRTGNTGIVVSGVEGVFHNNFFKINFNKKQINKDYLLFFLKDNRTKKIILEKAGTSTIPDLNHNDFYSIHIPLPPSIKEQTAIATILSDMDSELESLEKKRDKYLMIKQGMMQQLLTGKIRLI